MKNILLIGLSHFGKHVAEELADLGHEIMAVDINEEKVNEILPIVTNAQIGDSTNADFLKSLGVRNYDVCMVTMAKRDVQEKFLLRNGADEVVYPEKQVAKWAAIRYSADHLLDYVELDDEYSIFEVEVPLAWIGKTVGQIDIRKKYNINIMAFRQNGKLDASVSPDTLLTDQITLLVLGEYKALQKCFKI